MCIFNEGKYNSAPSFVLLTICFGALSLPKGSYLTMNCVSTLFGTLTGRGGQATLSNNHKHPY